MDRKLALVTTSNHARIDTLLERHGLTDLFAAVVCGDDVSNLKPDAEPIDRALSLLAGSKKQAIMIGDSEKDVETATNAGIDSILFHPKRHATFYDLDTLKLLNPTYVVEDLRDILELA